MSYTISENNIIRINRGDTFTFDFTIYDEKGKQIALTERDQELIDKAASGFEKENSNA